MTRLIKTYEGYVPLAPGTYCHKVGLTNRQTLDFLADHTIGRAYGTVCRLSVCLSSSVDVCL